VSTLQKLQDRYLKNDKSMTKAETKDMFRRWALSCFVSAAKAEQKGDLLVARQWRREGVRRYRDYKNV